MKDVPWLSDHRLVPDAVFPGAAYLSMAVEAAMRVYNEFPEPLKIRGFSLRDVAIKKSLTIPEDDYGVEILTSMEFIDTTTAKSPTWTTFSISSVGRETNEWTEHATGSVKVEIEDVDTGVNVDVQEFCTRRVDTKAWYKKFLSIGLGYGPTFQSLSNIRVDSEKRVAVADLALNTTGDTIKGGESTYPLHPASIDGAIQLGLIACHDGRISEAHTAFVPVQISDLYLRNDISGGACIVVAHGERRGVRSANLSFQMLDSKGEVLLHVAAIRCTSFSTEKPLSRIFSSPYTRLTWKPDIRKLSRHQARQIYPPPKENVEKSQLWGVTNKLAHFLVYSMYESFGKSQNGPKPRGDAGHFYKWIKRTGEGDHSEFMEEARQYAIRGELLQKINELVCQAPEVMEVRIAKLLHDNMEDILYERRTGVDVIISEDLLTPLYKSGLLMTGIYPQLFNVLDGIAHSNPNLRILEIGGGTGGATRIAIKAFSGPNGIKAYKDYTFTDISAGFLSSARESFADFRDFKFSVFDTEVDPGLQGYGQDYDLIIACQVLHATSNMKNTLTNCRKLLRQGGRLVLVETNQNFIVPGVVVGTFTGYWAGIPDGRVDAPFQSLDSWDKSLREAGFSGLDVVLDDFPAPHNTTSVILSTVSPVEEAKGTFSANVHVLYGSSTPSPLVEKISDEFKRRGVNVKTSAVEKAVEVISTESRVVALFNEKQLLTNATKQDVETFQHLARNAQSFISITSCGTARGRNADGALISGLLRVLQTENPVSRYTSIDIDAEDFGLEGGEIEDLARSIADQEFSLQRPSWDDDENPRDREFSWQDGSMWVSRHVPDAGFYSKSGIENQTVEMLPLKTQAVVRAVFETPGVINSLCFKASDKLLQPLPHDHIDVQVAAVGLSWRDLDQWSGRLDVNHLSSEYAGTVTAVGLDVKHVKVGDRVYGLGKGEFGNYTRVPAMFANKLQPNDDLVQMASLPMAYATAIYAFDHIAHLREGATVLIHLATTDVGLASIAIAKAKGADVFAVVESLDQAAFLEDIGLPVSNIVSSHASSLRKAASTTSKGKFDIILSTDQGELLHTSLEVLANLGHLIELGRADASKSQAIGSRLVQKSANYCSIDPWAVFEADPSLGEELIRAVDTYYRKGDVVPRPKITQTDVAGLSQVLPAFSKLIGKLVVTFTDPESLVRMIPTAPTVKFDTESTYIITGGLGGLGLSIVRWMAERGAKHMVLLSRRNITSVPEAQRLAERLASRDISVQGFECDITQKDQVNNAIQRISSSRPIKGIVHAAVSYLDLTFDKLSPARWNEGLSAKVDGTKNLHDATLSMQLDFFVMTTSALSLYAFATQGAYTAANNFQDAFARYRRKMGLPASTVSFSLIHDITNVGTDSITMDLFERNKTHTMGESQFLKLLEPAFMNNKTAHEDVSEQWSGQGQDPLSVANLHTYLDPAAMVARKREEGEATSSSTPQWYSDGRASLMMRAFSDAQRQSENLAGPSDEGAKNSVAHIRRGFEMAVKAGPSGRNNTVTFVQDAITTAVAQMLFIDVESVDPGKSVADSGVDSLIAAELRNWFHQALGANISMLDLLDPAVAISELAAKITDEALGMKE